MKIRGGAKNIPLEERALTFGHKVTATQATSLLVEKFNMQEHKDLIYGVLSSYDNAHEGAEELYSAIRNNDFWGFVDEKLDIEPECKIASIILLSEKDVYHHGSLTRDNGKDDPHMSSDKVGTGSDTYGPHRKVPNKIHNCSSLVGKTGQDMQFNKDPSLESLGVSPQYRGMLKSKKSVV